MNNLTRYDNDGLELFIDLSTGESFASISGYARMVGKDKSVISKRVSTLAELHKVDLKRTQIPTTTGSKTVALLTEDIMSEWIVDDSPEVASKMLKAGIRTFIHTLAGYEVTSSAMALPTTKEGKISHSRKLLDESNEAMDLTHQKLKKYRLSADKYFDLKHELMLSETKATTDQKVTKEKLERN